MDCDEEMAKNCFGYGRWTAPFWFIGPEQGMVEGKDGELEFRCKAWQNRGSLDLDDCIKFHQELEKLRTPKLNKHGKRIDDWHGETPNTQKTWSRLIQFLMGYGVSGVTNHLDYQKHHWGTENGQTCVAELSGLPAHNSAVKRNRKKFLSPRLSKLNQFLTGQQEFVLLYGKTAACETAWESLTQESVPLGRCSRGEAVHRKDNTLLVQARFHPADRRQSYEMWNRLGKEVRVFQHSA